MSEQGVCPSLKGSPRSESFPFFKKIMVDFVAAFQGGVKGSEKEKGEEKKKRVRERNARNGGEK